MRLRPALRGPNTPASGREDGSLCSVFRAPREDNGEEDTVKTAGYVSSRALVGVQERRPSRLPRLAQLSQHARVVGKVGAARLGRFLEGS